MSGTDLSKLELNPEQIKQRESFLLGIKYTGFLERYNQFLKTDGTNYSIQRYALAKELEKENSGLIKMLDAHHPVFDKESEELNKINRKIKAYIVKRAQPELIARDTTEQIHPIPFKR